MPEDKHTSLAHRFMNEQEHWLWNNGVSIPDHLPYTFPNDEFELRQYTPVCPDCHKEVDDSALVRGTMIQVMAEVLVIRSVAFCNECRTYLSNVVRVRANDAGHSIESLGEVDGWVKTKFVDKHPVRSFFRDLFGKKSKVKANV